MHHSHGGRGWFVDYQSVKVSAWRTATKQTGVQALYLSSSL